MRSNFDAQLKELNLDMLKMAGEVENIINMSMRAFLKGEHDVARETIEYDYQINEIERQIERTLFEASFAATAGSYRPEKNFFSP